MRRCVLSAVLLATLGPVAARAEVPGAAGGSDAADATGPADPTETTQATGATSAPHRHALHAPIGIGAGHTLARGGFAIGYAFDREHYRGLRDDTHSQGAQQVRVQDGFTSAPDRFDVERHELALMWAPTARVTTMLRVPYLRKEMRNIGPAGPFTTHADGIGDIGLSAIARFMKKGDERSYLSVELGVPTGSIRRGGATGGGFGRLPYPMQLGSGTWSLKPALTYEGPAAVGTFGARLSARFHFGRNALGYRPRARYRVSAWYARRWVAGVSTSLRLQWQKWGNLDGADPGLVPTSSPSADSRRQKGQRLDLGAGLDVHLPFANQALAFEGLVPLVQELDGPQVDFEWKLRAGWRWAF